MENVHAAIVERACFDPTVAGDEQRWFRCCVNIRCCRIRGKKASVIVGRERLNARQMIGTMCGARDGLRMVMKDSFSSVILIEENAQEKRVEEMESCGMEALSRVVASSVRSSVGVD